MSDLTDSSSYLQGVSSFYKAKRKAFWQEILSHFGGKSAELLSFDEIKKRLRLREEHYRGLQDIPVDRIVGSVGRYRDFTSTFLPKKDEMVERWSRIYAQTHSLGGLPPIEVYQVDDVYFVRDGNHRVSVARQIGAPTIQAYVTELPTGVDLEPGMSEKELEAAEAHALFLETTKLNTTRPHHQPIKLTEPSRYHELLGHIFLHASLLERERGEAVTTEEAAADWYDNIYRPAVTLIRKYNMLELFDERSEADLYLWMVDHLREVREAFGDEARSKRFSDAIVDFLTERKIPVPKDLLYERDPSVIVTETQAMKAVEANGNDTEHGAHHNEQETES